MPGKLKNCLVCAAEFVSYPNKKEHTCSIKCQAIRRTLAPVVKTCERAGCTETFRVNGRQADSDKRFCSRSCSAIHRNMFRKKVSETVVQRATRQKTKAPLIGPNICITCTTPTKNKKFCCRRCMLDHENSRPFETLSWESMRARVIKEQNSSCSSCGLNEWLGRKLPLEIDHIDGNNKNNNRANLTALCGNCHSITTTWRGRNVNRASRVSDEDLLYALSTHETVHQALISLGMTPKGGNYARVGRLMRKLRRDLDARAGYDPALSSFNARGLAS